MKMTKLKHINRMLDYLIENTHTYGWEVKLSMDSGTHTRIHFVCGDFSREALFLNIPETPLDGTLEKVVGLYFDHLESTKCTIMKSSEIYLDPEIIGRTAMKAIMEILRGRYDNPTR